MYSDNATELVKKYARVSTSEVDPGQKNLQIPSRRELLYFLGLCAAALVDTSAVEEESLKCDPSPT